MNNDIKEIYLSNENSRFIGTHDNMGCVMINGILTKNITYEEYVGIISKTKYFLLVDKDYITNLQSKIDKANELLEEILVVSDWEHKGRFRPVKGTTAQNVYKTIVKLNELLETPGRTNYELLKEERKTLYKYTPEKGFRLVGDEDE